MKVNIVSTFNRNCGIGQYTEQLSQKLVSTDTAIQTFRKDGPTSELFHPYPYRSLRSWQHRVAPFFLKQAIAKASADLWHADYVSAHQALTWADKKQPRVVTVHDAIPFHHPGNSLDFRIYKWQMKQAIAHAEYLITVSESARKDLIEQTRVSPSRVVSIPNGIDTDRFEVPAQTSAHEVFKIRYLGGLGATHKNVPLLLYMAHQLEQEGVRFSLELGGYLPAQHPLRDLARKLGLNAVSFPGFIPDEQKASFLAEADLFVFPSLMEGFGFPPMEAMAAGTAVLASRIPVFEELLGDAALLVDPSPKWFARGVRDMMESQTLKKELASKGNEHVRQYSWERTAEKTREVYHQAVHQNH